MARLEFIFYVPHRPEICGTAVQWVPRGSSRSSIDRLPQIYWSERSQPWLEPNHWALDLLRNGGVKIKTVSSLMEHLHKYANWLEQNHVDWRHFPKNKSERVLVRFRGSLIEARDRGDLSPSTTSARMRAVIRFYRFCADQGYVGRTATMWNDKVARVRYFDSVGFERTLTQLSSDIAIPNRSRRGLVLEDGLLPLTVAHTQALLSFTQERSSPELHLMLIVGFFTGARLGTILSLRVPNLEQAVRDPLEPGIWVVAVGPGTGIQTKFDVSGDLLIPDELMKLLRAYAYSVRHLDRLVKAGKKDKALLFLTRQGLPFRLSTVAREMVELRRNAMRAGLKFAADLKFHQTRATYGTWLMTIALSTASVRSAIEFVKRAMLHKHEATTFRYITFLEQTKAKVETSNAFSEAFLGLASRMRKRHG